MRISLKFLKLLLDRINAFVFLYYVIKTKSYYYALFIGLINWIILKLTIPALISNNYFIVTEEHIEYSNETLFYEKIR